MLRPLAFAALVLIAGIGAGCDSKEEAVKTVKDVKDQAEQAADATKEVADNTVKGANDAIDVTKKAIDATKATAAQAGKLWADIPGTGQLSETAKGWLKAGTDPETVEAIVAKGVQIAPVAMELGRTLGESVSRESKIEPIYQKIDPETGKPGDSSARDRIDKAIGDMPRVEVIDGLTIGFKQLDKQAANTLVKERGYLVTWREGDHLIGFVYRSKRTIDLEQLISDMPKLLGLAKSAVNVLK